jgi:ParB/RepB/Spo0J family partition protein
MLIDINKIKVHEEHEKIYSATNIEDLKQSIQELGLLQPLIVNKRFVLISGFRRFTAVKQLNFSEVEVEIRDFSQEDEVLALISFNKQRVKTTRE